MLRLGELVGSWYGVLVWSVGVVINLAFDKTTLLAWIVNAVNDADYPVKGLSELLEVNLETTKVLK